MTTERYSDELKRAFLAGFNEFLNDYGGSYALMESLAKYAHVRPVTYVFLTCLGGYNVSDNEDLGDAFLGQYWRIKITAPIIPSTASSTRRKARLTACAKAFESGVIAAINAH